MVRLYSRMGIFRRRTMVRLYCRVIDNVAAATVESAAHDTHIAQLRLGNAQMASHSAPQLGGHHALLGREVDFYALWLYTHL